jgi:hypothetical protein
MGYRWTTDKFLDRFWSQVQQGEGCWLWVGGKTGAGYGHFKHRIDILTHRLSWELHNRKPIPPGMFVIHSCDNPACVNPDHLSVGTSLDNMRDKMKKGRHRTVRGEDAPWSRLTTAEIIAIRRAHRSGLGYKKLGKLFGINDGYACQICQHKRWRHVAEDD